MKWKVIQVENFRFPVYMLIVNGAENGFGFSKQAALEDFIRRNSSEIVERILK